jgi:hypothetical protein
VEGEKVSHGKVSEFVNHSEGHEGVLEGVDHNMCVLGRYELHTGQYTRSVRIVGWCREGVDAWAWDGVMSVASYSFHASSMVA